MDINKNFSRRDFVKASAIGIVAATIPLTACNDDHEITSTDDSYGSTSDVLNADVIQTMVDESILQLTGEIDVGAAWKSLMPNLTTASIIAIKVNCRASALPTHPEVTYAVVDGLSRMLIDGVGFPVNNIHIYDNYKAYLEDSGYTENTSSVGAKCYSETSFSTTSYNVNGKSIKVCSVVHDKADYLINIAVLKNHYSMAGASLCMKNHFGTVDSPREFHYNYGDPYIGALNAIEPIYSKQVLAILDGILGAAEGGPYGSPTFVANKIIMSADTVAVDYQGREILREYNSSTVEWATYIDSAADYGIGTNEPEKMEIVNILNPSGDKIVTTTPASSGETLCRVVIAKDETASNV
jgi:uncharacterized protein (DUF362 family)